MYFGREPYGQEEYIRHHGDGSCMYRGEDFGQPQALSVGDVLANGLIVAGKPFEAGNGGVGLRFTDGSERVVPARIPLLLQDGNYGKLPLELEVGDIFETGCVVLSQPGELDEEDPRYEVHRDEVQINITGGFEGASIGVPSDLVIALHNETYPPSSNSLLGAFIIKETLEMGARARRNLPNYGRLDTVPEPERLVGVFEAIETLRQKAQKERATYKETLAALQAQCEGLRGVELLITGQLEGRGNFRVSRSDPRSQVENLHIEVSSASVVGSDGHGGLIDQQVPYIAFQGRTIEDDEHVSAWLGVDKFGVTAQIIDTASPQE